MTSRETLNYYKFGAPYFNQSRVDLIWRYRCVHVYLCHLACRIHLISSSSSHRHPRCYHAHATIIIVIDCLHHHYNDVIMGAIASQTTSLSIIYPTIYSDADQRKHQSSMSLAFVWGIHRAQRASNAEKFSFDDVIMIPHKICTQRPIMLICSERLGRIPILTFFLIFTRFLIVSDHFT